jgi:hypothetical protein
MAVPGRFEEYQLHDVCNDENSYKLFYFIECQVGFEIAYLLVLKVS